MDERDKQAVIKALQAIASALSFCDTDMEPVMWDRIKVIHEAIAELKGGA